MNISPSLLNDPNLVELVRTFKKGEYIFKQGEPGTTMYLVVNGVVSILYKKFRMEHLVGIIPAGEIIGEKGILDKNPYRRNFTASAKSDCILIEVDASTLKFIQKIIPDFQMRILRMVLERLDKANRLVNLLQLTDPAERLAEYMIYFAEEHCEGVPKNFEVGMAIDEIQYAANLDRQSVEAGLQELVNRGIIIRNENGYFLKDKNRLQDFLPSLRAKLAA